MGSIGLYDWDMVEYSHVPLNLEIMKYAAYFKKHKILTTLTPYFMPDHFSDYYVRKDYDDKIFPEKLFQKNIILGGHAFSGEKYIPLNEDIEGIEPDREIYFKNAQYFCTGKEKSKMFETMIHAGHLRLSLDGKTIWKDYEKQVNLDKHTRCFMFHDYDLNKIEHSREIINFFLTFKKYDTFIGTKFPIQCYTSEDLLRWSDVKVMGENFCIEYNGVIDNEAFAEFLSRNDHNSLPRQLNYNVTYGCKDQNDFVKNRLSQIYDQVCFSRNHFKLISLKSRDNFFVDQRWERLLTLFTSYMRNGIRNNGNGFCERYIVNNDPLINLIRSFPTIENFEFFKFSRSECRDLFLMVKEQNYEVFKKFYEQSKVKLVGGEFKNDTDIHCGTNKILE